MKLLNEFVSVTENVGLVSAFCFFDANAEPNPQVLSADELQIYSKFSSRKRKNEFIAGRIACKKAFWKFIHSEQIPIAKFSEISINNNEKGAPFIEGSELCPSLAHSHGIAIATIGNFAVGVDIEKIDPKKIAALKKMCTESESCEVCELTVIWTLKEALSKALGTGIVKNFETYDTKNICHHGDTLTCEFKNFPQFRGVALFDELLCISVVNQNKNFCR